MATDTGSVLASGGDLAPSRQASAVAFPISPIRPICPIPPAPTMSSPPSISYTYLPLFTLIYSYLPILPPLCFFPWPSIRKKARRCDPPVREWCPPPRTSMASVPLWQTRPKIRNPHSLRFFRSKPFKGFQRDSKRFKPFS